MVRWLPNPTESARLELILDGVLPGPYDLEIPTLQGDSADSAEVELIDDEGTPVARLEVTARSGARVSGRVEALQAREDGLFRHRRRTPEAVRAHFSPPGARPSPPPGSDPPPGARPSPPPGSDPPSTADPSPPGAEPARIGALVVTAPFDTPTLQGLSADAQAYDGIVLLPVLTPGLQRLCTPAGLVRATDAAAALLDAPTLVVPIPLPGLDSARAVAQAYGEPIDRKPTEQGLQAIGYALNRGRMLKPELVPEPVAAVLRAERPPKAQRGLVILCTGLSGSGKSTLARRLRDQLLERGGRAVTLLDGDVVRRMLSAGLGFSRADRDANVRRIGFVAAEIARAGGIALCAPIAPYASTRAEVRATVTAAGANFLLVHVSTPLAVCERRDRKGLYARARAGELPEFTGISDPYEPPEDADLAIDTSTIDPERATAMILERLADKGFLA